MVAKLSKLKEGLEVDMEILPPQLGVQKKSKGKTVQPLRKKQFRSWSADLDTVNLRELKNMFQRGEIKGRSMGGAAYLRDRLKKNRKLLDEMFESEQDPFALSSNECKALARKLDMQFNNQNKFFVRLRDCISVLGVDTTLGPLED